MYDFYSNEKYNYPTKIIIALGNINVLHYKFLLYISTGANYKLDLTNQKVTIESKFTSSNLSKIYETPFVGLASMGPKPPLK